jgi:hypothetical protein
MALEDLARELVRATTSAAVSRDAAEAATQCADEPGRTGAFRRRQMELADAHMASMRAELATARDLLDLATELAGSPS